jgi:hypothetical protein
MQQVVGWRDRTFPPAPPKSPSRPTPPKQSATLDWAGRALANPPEDLPATVVYCIQRWGNVPLLFPLGWYRDSSSKPDCAAVSFLNGTYHILISGQSRIGKDNLATQIMLSLALCSPPEQVQFCIIDGKGLDFVGLAGKAHTWRLAGDIREIAPAMAALTQERERRGRVLRQAQVSKWENYGGDDLPLLVCYISELSLLEDATSKTELTTWLNSEMTAGAAFGIRYIVATQTASNFHTRWRSQISLYLAGFQPSQTQDQPNTGLTTKELRAAGGVPPSELRPYPDGAGVFTAVHGREVETVRTGYFSDEHRRMLLDRLPNKPVAPATNEAALQGPLPPTTTGASPALEQGETPLPATLSEADDGEPDPVNPSESWGDESRSGSSVAVSAGERESILAVWERLHTNGNPPSRRAVCREVFDGATGGSAYRKVQAVLDEVGGGTG